MIPTSDINELLEEAKSELKRADHLVFVSLKYTRTVDVIRSVVERLINAFEFGCHILLEDAKKGGLIKSYPASTGVRIELLMNLLSYEQEIISYLNLFVLLRKIIKADFSRMEEYRRHVRMIVTIDTGETLEVNIDNVKENFERTTKFLEIVKSRINSRKND